MLGNIEAVAHRVKLPDDVASMAAERIPLIAAAVAGEVLSRPARQAHLTLEATGAAASAPLIRAIAHAVRAQAPHITLALRAPLLAAGALDWVVDDGVLLVTALHDSLAVHLPALHQVYQHRGIDPEAAYVEVEVDIDAARIEAGPRELVRTLGEMGARYVALRAALPSKDAFGTFYRAALEAILSLNERGALMVEKGLALHLETMKEPIRAEHALRVVHDDEKTRTSVTLPMPAGASCAGCRYLEVCGATRIEALAFEHPPARERGSAFCDDSMVRFDAAASLLSDGRIEPVYARWMQARDRVAQRSARPAGA